MQKLNLSVTDKMDKITKMRGIKRLLVSQRSSTFVTWMNGAHKTTFFVQLQLLKDKLISFFGFKG